jgi:tyrosine-protein kinase Etk/Wzc
MANTNPGIEEQDGRGISLLDLVLVLSRHRRLVLGLPAGITVIALIVALLLPKWYAGTAKIMPPQQSQSNAVAILGQLGALAGGAAQALGVKNPSDIYVTILKSRTVADNLIRKFDLMNVYGEDYLVEARKKLASNSLISASREGVITIEVEDKDPKRSADLANAYIEELRAITVQLAVSEAGQRRLFFEGQVSKTKDDLISAEHALKLFTTSTGLVNPEGQMGLTVATAAALRAQITAKEVQLSATRSFATNTNPDVQRISQEIAGLRIELGRLEKDTSVGKGDVLVSVGAAPEVGLEYLRRFREVKYQESLYMALSRQYEIARIDEAKDATLIQVLDAAVVPERKVRPKRALIVAAAFVASALLAALLAFVSESMQRASRNPEMQARLEELLRLR